MALNRSLALVVAVLGCWVGPAMAQQSETEKVPEKPVDPRIDAATGRDLAHWPPDRLFDHRHMRLEMVIGDMESKEFSATETLTVSPIGVARAGIVLDAGMALRFSKVTVNGAPAAFTHEKEKLAINFPQAAKVGSVVTIVSTYSGKEATSGGNGLCWFKSRSRGEGEEPQPPQLYSQGEAQWNHLWFPCHDFPNEKLTSEIAISVPEGFEVVSNGRLLSKDAGRGGLVKWHWLQDKPHSAYLVTLAVGKWDVVDVGGKATARPGIAMPVYGRPGTADQLREKFQRTPDMVAFFERYFDEPYPWDKYAQVLVRNFRWGGMENTSATTLSDTAAGGRDIDDLIAHELAHQWTGDLVTCKSWDHLWLNEGWATFAEWLWVEHEHGADEYLQSVRNAVSGLRSPRARSVAEEPMVWKYYDDPDAVFTKSDDPYAKGGLVLHMLRKRLGDEGLRRGMALFLDRYKFGVAETDDFRRVLEEVSGQSLERFFDQWARRAGLPRLVAEFEWDSSKSELMVRMEQSQGIDADHPAYGMRVPIWVEFGEVGDEAEGAVGGANGQWISIDTDQRVVSKGFKLKAKPTGTMIDPYVTNAAKVTIRKKVGGEE